MNVGNCKFIKLGTDTLHGFTNAKKVKLGTLRKTWVDTKNRQTESSTAAKTAHADFRILLKSIED